ncbi:MAG: hypothetical protein HC876_02630 [Chloroflexaceae bacterium]|nr:hypothetical protein [Chloroflexaceae bacterium]
MATVRSGLVKAVAWSMSLLLILSVLAMPVQPVSTVQAAELPTVRFAQFNASLNRSSEGQLITDLSTPDNAQAQVIAEIIQRVNPDVVLINEFDYNAAQPNTAAELFLENYLNVGQNGANPIDFTYYYVAPSNTGIPSGFDFNNNGEVGGGDDAFGFGFFPGQFGMILYSKYPIVDADVRTFQNFLWKDMPGALLPDDPNTPAPADWYSNAELNVFRLSSKSHWDVPINIDGTIVHALVSHPTPPVFDGPEDRNGTRNHDEIRFWADYVTSGKGDYIYDDDEGPANPSGGLPADARFVIMGDQNADPFDGDSTMNAVLQLLDNPFINTTRTPVAPGGVEAAANQGGANANHRGFPGFDTADFADGTPGNLRADYVLPSNNLGIAEAGIFWPTSDSPLFDRLVGNFPFPSSDHRMVYVDITLENTLPNGIASGDVTQDSAWLWARSTMTGDITFEYSTNPGLLENVATVVETVTDPTIPVKTEITGLEADTTYYYRVTDPAGVTADGQFTTAAEVGSYEGLRFGVVGDWQEPPPFPSLVNVPERNLDLFIQHSDNIYADISTPAVPISQTRTLEEFRLKYNEVYSSVLGFNTMANLRRNVPILATIDDHEVTNDFAGGASQASDALNAGNFITPGFSRFGDDPTALINDAPLYENAMQVFQEFQPLENRFYANTGSDPRMDGERQLYRYRTYGSDVAFFVTDPRSFRDAQLVNADITNPADIARFLAEAFDPTRTMLGERQLDRLKQDLQAAENADITWKFVFVSEPTQNFGPLLAPTVLRAMRQSAASCCSSSMRMVSRTWCLWLPTSTVLSSTT